jgi:hypothetical protein
VKNRHGISICNNCHRPTTRVFGTDGRQLWDNLSCSEACDEDLSALLDGVPLAEVMTGGRSVDCSCVAWCAHCADSAGVRP